MKTPIKGIIFTLSLMLAACMIGAAVIEVRKQNLDTSILTFTIAASALVAVIIIGIVRHFRRKAQDVGVNEAVDGGEANDGQRAFGIVLVASGFAGGLFTFLFYNVGRGGYFNLALGAERNIILAACAFTILIGVLLIGFAQISKR